jgi:polysaccharide chain length determinant protein (PEP-CTERM system associated)
MINPEKAFNIHDYVEILLRRKWYIVVPFMVIVIAAVLYAFFCPKEYQATATILVVQQKIPESFVKPTVTARIEEQIQSIGQEVMSRSKLERVISELKLYQQEVKSGSLEGVLRDVRSNIQIGIPAKERMEKEKAYFTISYTGKDSREVSAVANKLASLFIEEDLKLRETMSQGATEFISIELDATKAKLEEQEKTIIHFKRQFFGELPEQLGANTKVLEQLQLLYQRIGENLRSAQDRKLIIQKQISDTELLLASAPNTSLSNKGDNLTASLIRSLKDPREGQLEQFKNQLADLQTKYTEKHPDILVLKKRITELEAQLEKERSEKQAEEPVIVSELSEPKAGAKTEKKGKESELRLNPNYKQMESQLIATELEIQRLRADEDKVKAQINVYRQRIENTPLRDQALTLISRDYQNTKDTYQTLLRKSEEARQAENLERRQKGKQFRVVNPATVPDKPFKPNVLKILLFGFLAGVVGGIGMAFGREQLDSSFRDPEDLEAALGFKVLANIPKIEKKAA